MTLSIQVDKTVSWVPEVLCGIYCGTTKRLTTLLRYITNSYLAYVAERVGFEPTKGYKPLLVFKTSAFNRSATSPR